MRIQSECTCRHPDGLPVLAAVHIVRIVLHAQSGVSIEANGRCANATDINGLLSLSIRNGDTVIVIADGKDAHNVMTNIESVLSDHTNRRTRAAGHRQVPALVPA